MNTDWLSWAWKVLVARGAAALVIGLLVLVWPGETVVAFVIVWGVWALIDGIGSIVQGFGSDPSGPRWAHLLMGAASLVVAVFAIFSPVVTATTLTWILGIWLVARGLLEFVGALVGRAGRSRTLMVAGGVVDVVLGVLFIANPGKSAVGIAAILGLVTMLWGAVFLVVGLVVRSQQREHAPPGTEPATA